MVSVQWAPSLGWGCWVELGRRFTQATFFQVKATSSMSTVRPALWVTSQPLSSGNCWDLGSQEQKEQKLSTLPASWLPLPTALWLHS